MPCSGSRDDLIRRDTLSDADLSIIQQRRGAANRLGFAVHQGTECDLVLFKKPVLWHLRNMMKADRVEVSWDEQKKKWLIRIAIGEEVIRRYCEEAKSADQTKLRSLAAQTAVDEGYEVAPTEIVLN